MSQTNLLFITDDSAVHDNMACLQVDQLELLLDHLKLLHLLLLGRARRTRICSAARRLRIAQHLKLDRPYRRILEHLRRLDRVEHILLVDCDDHIAHAHARFLDEAAGCEARDDDARFRVGIHRHAEDDVRRLLDHLVLVDGAYEPRRALVCC